jgi:hypothetical protein
MHHVIRYDRMIIYLSGQRSNWIIYKQLRRMQQNHGTAKKKAKRIDDKTSIQ